MRRRRNRRHKKERSGRKEETKKRGKAMVERAKMVRGRGPRGNDEGDEVREKNKSDKHRIV